ncbi:MAG: imidazole glycerol phosphate synthase subunit HisH [Vulcanimicrobiaceae bacterium]
MRSAEVVVVDYGGGNLGSLLAALEREGASYAVSGDPSAVSAAAATIFPGDGAFGATMDALHERELDEAIRRSIEAERPFLGICVGMQILFERSLEFGASAGLGVLPGQIDRFEAAPRVPHMGWNLIEPIADHPFIAGLDGGEYAYFLHSYRAEVGPATAAVTEHGERFSSVVAQRNVMGTQFHPEKSQSTGAKLLRNFLAIARGGPRP